MDARYVIASMSHEIRAPINNIVGFAELALEQAASSQMQSYLEKILENSNEILITINDVLDIAKIESGQMQLESAAFDISEVFAQCKSDILPKARAKKVRVDFHTEPSFDGRLLVGDPARLNQVLYNVVGSAVNFTGSGAVRVSSAITYAAEDTQTIHFQISDNGTGMTREQIDRIYEPFANADFTAAFRYSKTGLRMSIAKSLVELMGGKLSIDSVPSEGTTVRFELTFATGEGGEKHHVDVPREEQEEIEQPHFNGHVLLCEDNEMSQMIIQEHLERIGLEVDVADNGLEGVGRVRERVLGGMKPYDLILMDTHMPVMDGLEAARKITELATATPIVAMRTNSVSDYRELYKRMGMENCLVKPFASQELWRCLLGIFG